ncbi:MAG TPA: transporter [Candidatus Limnocylindria bacterium]|jgi:hypothetical protein|nr:transporter [Candidatus Limnocylindria bacterium]
MNKCLLGRRCSGWSGLAVTVFATARIFGDSPGLAPDKSMYSLFNPTPREAMRELSADRPDKTDSPMTVDAGHFQVEMDFASVTFDRDRDTETTAYDITPALIKLGVLNNVDAQLVLTHYRSERVRDRVTGEITTVTGWDDITPRLKWNLLGNDGGFFSLALLPFAKIPTATHNLGNGAIEGGLKIPYALDVPGWDVGLQSEYSVGRNDSAAGYHWIFANSVSVGRPILGKLSYFVEFYGAETTETGRRWVGTIDTWFTYQCSENLRLDLGVYIGVTDAAEDWHPFVGMTWRY